MFSGRYKDIFLKMTLLKERRRIIYLQSAYLLKAIHVRARCHCLELPQSSCKQSNFNFLAHHHYWILKVHYQSCGDMSIIKYLSLTLWNEMFNISFKVLFLKHSAKSQIYIYIYIYMYKCIHIYKQQRSIAQGTWLNILWIWKIIYIYVYV